MQISGVQPRSGLNLRPIAGSRGLTARAIGQRTASSAIVRVFVLGGFFGGTPTGSRFATLSLTGERQTLQLPEVHPRQADGRLEVFLPQFQ